ncbi:MAG: zinc ribbon domain-containing protein [Candidatus Bathyarchaeia archaeon]
MPYCLKCGNNVDETMAFCPKCGAALKSTTPSEVVPESEEQEKQEKHENPADVEIQDKNQYGFVRYLIAGLILIIVGVFAILDLTSRISASGQDIAIVLIIIGIIIIIGAIYVTTPVRKYLLHLISHTKKEPANI